MRSAAETSFKDNPNFRSISGTAEHTSLKEGSIDLIFCGQAFHWFNLRQSKIEFARILKRDGHIALAWNQRAQKGAFLQAYERILKTYIPSYKQASHRNISDETLKDFFAPGFLSKTSLPNFQSLDEAGLKGRLLSSSYCPKEGQVFDLLMDAIDKLFDEHEKAGKVRFEYETIIYFVTALTYGYS